VDEIVNRLTVLKLPQIIISDVGDKASIIQEHLF
jgi:hypothetical protein